jgi:hypothetical protein
MHPDLLLEIARQRRIELGADAAAVRSRRSRRTPPGRIGARARLGRRLVRLGHRLAPAPRVVVATTNGRRPATMGP